MSFRIGEYFEWVVEEVLYGPPVIICSIPVFYMFGAWILVGIWPVRGEAFAIPFWPPVVLELAVF